MTQIMPSSVTVFKLRSLPTAMTQHCDEEPDHHTHTGQPGQLGLGLRWLSPSLLSTNSHVSECNQRDRNHMYCNKEHLVQ